MGRRFVLKLQPKFQAKAYYIRPKLRETFPGWEKVRGGAGSSFRGIWRVCSCGKEREGKAGATPPGSGSIGVKNARNVADQLKKKSAFFTKSFSKALDNAGLRGKR